MLRGIQNVLSVKKIIVAAAAAV